MDGEETTGQGQSAADATLPVCERLKALYADVAKEAIPEALIVLAARLQRAFDRGDLALGRDEDRRR